MEPRDRPASGGRRGARRRGGAAGTASRRAPTGCSSPCSRAGHGASGNVDGTVLVRTAAFDLVEVDVEARVARIGAGVAVGSGCSRRSRHRRPVAMPVERRLERTAFTLGGGHSWFAAHGLPLSSPRGRALTADGRHRWLRDADDPSCSRRRAARAARSASYGRSRSTCIRRRCSPEAHRLRATDAAAVFRPVSPRVDAPPRPRAARGRRAHPRRAAGAAEAPRHDHRDRRVRRARRLRRADAPPSIDPRGRHGARRYDRPDDGRGSAPSPRTPETPPRLRLVGARRPSTTMPSTDWSTRGESPGAKR